MSSYDITFCTDKNCSRLDCHRHYNKAMKAIENGAIFVWWGDSKEEGCTFYWKEDQYGI